MGPYVEEIEFELFVFFSFFYYSEMLTQPDIYCHKCRKRLFHKSARLTFPPAIRANYPHIINIKPGI